MEWLKRLMEKFNPDSLRPKTTLFKTSMAEDVFISIILVVTIISGEFFSRRVVSVLLPTYFSYFFMDLVCLGGFYLVLCFLVYIWIRRGVAEKAGYLGFSLGESYQKKTLYIALVMIVIGIQGINRLDVFLFSGFNWNAEVITYLEEVFNTSFYVNVPMYSDYSRLAVSTAFLLINGVWAPVAEEFLWRGIVQTKLSYYLHPWVVIGVVSLFFSLKHAVVDLVLTRFLFLVVFGFAVGWARQRTNTGVSTSVHIYINFVATLIAVLTKWV